MYDEEEVFLLWPEAVFIFAFTTNEFSTHFGKFTKLSTGNPFSSVKYPPPLIILTFEVVALIALSETIMFLKSARTSEIKSGNIVVGLNILKVKVVWFKGIYETNAVQEVELTGSVPVQGLK